MRVILIGLVLGLGAPRVHSSAWLWTEVSAEAGLDFQHVNGAAGSFMTPETYGSGVAFLDYDADGDADLYLVNSTYLDPPSDASAPTNRLFANEGPGTFRDVTEPAQAGHEGYGLGVAVGDVDNDGHPDVYVSNWGPNALLRNNGEAFRDISATAGVDDTLMGTSAAFGDYDLDGRLDLYVGNYARLPPENPCYQAGIRVYCGPLFHDGVSGVLYHNDGDGRFSDRTREMGVYSERGRQLGVLFADFDRDGDPDLYVANDAKANFYYVNEGGTFVETALLAGVAYSADGEPEAGMGTDAADYDNDADQDLIVTNYQWESNRLYRNEGGFFTDATAESGLASATLPFLAFGVKFLDVDNDRLLDLLSVNGHVDPNVEEYDRAARHAQRPLLFRNVDGRRFEEVGLVEGEGALRKLVARGSATADYDLDGDTDLCIATNGGRAQLLRNDAPQKGNWLQLHLVGTKANRSAIGARVDLVAGGVTHSAEVRSGSSYLSQSELPLHFGLGEEMVVSSVTVTWPGGPTQHLLNIAANQRVTIVEAP